LFYIIDEITTEKVVGHTYLSVRFWADKAVFDAGNPPLLVNDFVMQLRPTRRERVTNRDGWWKRLSDGVFIDPATLDPDLTYEWEMETVDVDVPAVIRANIEAYWYRAQLRGDRGSKTDPRIQRDARDPHSILSRPDVTALRSLGHEVG